LNKEEVKALVKNKKHQAMLLLAYSAGLQLGEIVWLELKDIDVGRADPYPWRQGKEGPHGRRWTL
jgi:site-specific recombinase XerD